MLTAVLAVRIGKGMPRPPQAGAPSAFVFHNSHTFLWNRWWESLRLSVAPPWKGPHRRSARCVNMGKHLCEVSRFPIICMHATLTAFQRYSHGDDPGLPGILRRTTAGHGF